MRAYSMDSARAGAPRQRCRDEGGRCGGEVPRERVVGAAAETAAARHGRGGASRPSDRDGRGMREPHLHTLAARMAAHPDRTLAELKDALATPASVPTVWRAVLGPRPDR